MVKSMITKETNTRKLFLSLCQGQRKVHLEKYAMITKLKVKSKKRVFVLSNIVHSILVFSDNAQLHLS